MNTTALIERLEALEEKATKGQQVVFARNGVVEIQKPNGEALVHWTGFDNAMPYSRQAAANARLYVELRNNLPTIISALRAQETANG